MINNGKKANWQYFSCMDINEVHIPGLCFSISRNVFLGKQSVIQ